MPDSSPPGEHGARAPRSRTPAARRRTPLIGAAAALAAVLVWQDRHRPLRHARPDRDAASRPRRVIADSAILVFREGLECILVLAAITAGLNDAYRVHSRPIAAGAGAGAAASFATWFVVVAVLGALGGASLDVRAATGLLAVVVLLVVMNWFFHRIYWTGWISSHNRRRRRLLVDVGPGNRRRVRLGLALLGFTCAYREGFEIVLFLQNLRLQYRAGVGGPGRWGSRARSRSGSRRSAPRGSCPLSGCSSSPACSSASCSSSWSARAPSSCSAGWLPTTTITVAIPGWLGLWFAVLPTVESLAAQVLAAATVIGSYVVAGEIRVKRSRRAARFAQEAAG